MVKTNENCINDHYYYLLFIIIIALQYRNKLYTKITIVRMMGYICTEGLQAREPVATKENKHIIT